MFTLIKDNELEYFQSEFLLSDSGVRHFFSTKNGGVSEGEFESLNLGFFTNDNEENIQSNFNIICINANMDSNVMYLNQEHGNKVFVVNKDNYKGIKGSKGDALVTNTKNLPIGVFTADCVPILLYDREKKVISSIHAGWRGVESKILTETINVMKNTFSSNSSDIVCLVGPSIGFCCFEVSDDVADKFSFKEKINGKYHVNLWREVYSEAINNGILKENIDMMEKCTVCNNNVFYSYRSESGKTGRLGSFIELT